MREKNVYIFIYIYIYWEGEEGRYLVRYPTPAKKGNLGQIVWNTNLKRQ